MTSAAVGLAAAAAVLLAACGSSSEKPTPTGLVRPELPARTTPKPAPKPDQRAKAPASGAQTTTGPAAAPVPPFDGPIVRITVHNDLCTPDSAAAPAGKAFQLRVRSTDHPYVMIFDSVHRFTVPAHGTGVLRVAAGSPDAPVLSNGGEPCAVVRVR